MQSRSGCLGPHEREAAWERLGAEQFDDRETVSASYGRATAEPASGGFITATHA